MAPVEGNNTSILQLVSPLHRQKEGSTSRLPEDLWAHIFSFLTAVDLATVSLVNKNFSTIAQADGLWKAVYFREFGDRHFRWCNHIGQPNWRACYRDVKFAGRNWQSGRCSEKTLIRSHPQGYISIPSGHHRPSFTAFAIDGDVLATASLPDPESKTWIELWDMRTGMQVCCMAGPQSSWWITHVDVEGDVVFAAEPDGHVVAWELPATFHQRLQWEANNPAMQAKVIFEENLGTQEGGVTYVPINIGILTQRTSPTARLPQFPVFQVLRQSGRPPMLYDNASSHIITLDYLGSKIYELTIKSGGVPDVESCICGVVVCKGHHAEGGGAHKEACNTPLSVQQMQEEHEVHLLHTVNGGVLCKLPIHLPEGLPRESLGLVRLSHESWVGSGRLVVTMNLTGGLEDHVQWMSVWDIQPLIQGGGKPELMSNFVTSTALVSQGVEGGWMVSTQGGPVVRMDMYGFNRRVCALGWHPSGSMCVLDAVSGGKVGRGPEGLVSMAQQAVSMSETEADSWFGLAADVLCFQGTQEGCESVSVVTAAEDGRLAVWTVPDGTWQQLTAQPITTGFSPDHDGIAALQAPILGGVTGVASWRWLVVLGYGQLRVFDFLEV